MNNERTIPDKNYFKIGEAARIVGVEPHTVRYWESTFKELKPAKTRSRQRLFRRRDVEMLLLIRTLLHEQRFTIEGAQEQLRAMFDAEIPVEDALSALMRDDATPLLVAALRPGGATPAQAAAPEPEPPQSGGVDPEQLEEERAGRLAAERRAELWRLKYDRLAMRMRERWEGVREVTRRR